MENIYQHFRKEEQGFVDQVIDWKSEVSLFYSPKLTDFLDPREQRILQSVIGISDEIGFSFWGGTPFVERKRAILFPSYFEVQDSDFQIQAFSLKYPTKFLTLSHKDVLGSQMSLGLKREKFGDILIKDDIIQFVVAKEIASYVQMNLVSIGQSKVKLHSLPLTELIEVQEEFEEVMITASSLRLDVTLAEIYNISRAKASQFIDRKLVKVNWKIIENPSFQVQEGDYLSIRKFGRSKILSLEGNTKKGKNRILVGIKK